ncbi:MAG: hypothetical protein HXY24_16525 [Rubrivivax sp.]|nr:hypothetical protein [Rubrivivax sp.]
MIYSFTTIDLCDLNRIEVWYAADPAAVTDYATLSAHAELANTYYSPTAGSVVEGDISGLVNGQTYYVWVVTIDNTGHATIGSYQSSMPEPTSSLTDLTGEDGGFNCFSSVAGQERGRPEGVALLLTPLLVGGALRRWRKAQVRRREELESS